MLVGAQRLRFCERLERSAAVERFERVQESRIIDVHAHIYPAGCFTEVLKDRADFKLVDNPRGQSLIYRGTHVMSMPAEQDDLKTPSIDG